MLQFRFVELSGQSCDLSTGQGERASVEHLVVVVHLHDIFGLSNKMYKKTNVSSCSFRSTLGEERLQTLVSIAG
jgi:hypothetical protein